MFTINIKSFLLTFEISKRKENLVIRKLSKYTPLLLLLVLTAVSIYYFRYYLNNHLGLAYNDARSHLDIGRRVVEGLKPGFAQLGSVWLPLPHLLMVLTIWNDFMWHTGLSGAIESMISFIATGLLIYYFLKELHVGMLGRIVGVAVFAANLNILYMQSTAMTELLLLATMTAGAYELMRWHKNDNTIHLLKSAFWIMLATLIRYDGWFLLGYGAVLVAAHTFKKSGYKASEGKIIFFCTLGGFGIFLWFLWNLLIFKDPLYFAFGPYSAHAQQAQLVQAGVLPSRHDLWLSLKIYWYAFAYNTYTLPAILSLIGAVVLLFDKTIKGSVRIATTALLVPLLFNIIALYFAFSVLFVQGISGNTWFNVRYGLMMIPSVAIYVGYLVSRLKGLKFVVIGLLLFTTFFAFANLDAVTVDDARVGSSQKNVSEVSGWLNRNASNKPGFVLISAASHDAIIFSSGLPMGKFIHEGTGAYWMDATTQPDRWARWIIMRTNDLNDQTFRLVHNTPGFKKYNLVGHYPFADIYEIKQLYVSGLNTKPVLGRQK